MLGRPRTYVCVECAGPLPSENEHKRKLCNPCRSLRRKASRATYVPTKGICTGCGEVCTLNDMDSRKCDSCRTKRTRAWAQANPERVAQKSRTWAKAHPEQKALSSRSSHLRRKYGLTLDEYAELSKEGCMVCSTTDRLHVDHCHQTGQVRGILCSNCNAGLGMFKDNLALLSKAIEYMKNWSEK